MKCVIVKFKNKVAMMEVVSGYKITGNEKTGIWRIMILPVEKSTGGWNTDVKIHMTCRGMRAGTAMDVKLLLFLPEFSYI